MFSSDASDFSDVRDFDVFTSVTEVKRLVFSGLQTSMTSVTLLFYKWRTFLKKVNSNGCYYIFSLEKGLQIGSERH